jgi:hypothetical protein
MITGREIISSEKHHPDRQHMRFRHGRTRMTNRSVPTYIVTLPEYTVEEEPDYLSAGGTLDRVIESHFAGKELVLRAVGLVDHPGLTLEELLTIIREQGTDRYDPDREGLYYGTHCPGNVRLHALECRVTDRLRSPHYEGERCPSGSVMGEVVADFYGGARIDRGYSVRLDVLMLYDLAHMETLGECLYRFRDPVRKQDALLGLIAILR